MNGNTQTNMPVVLMDEECDIRPIGDKVVVLPEDREMTTKSGLVMPSRDNAKPLVAKVVAVGEGRLSASRVMLPMPVKVGDRVMYHRYSGTEVKAGEKAAVLILEVDDIIAIIEG